MELKQCPEPQAGHAGKLYPQANFERLLFSTYIATVCHIIVIITLSCQDRPTSVTSCLIEAVEIQRRPWELYRRGWLERL